MVSKGKRVPQLRRATLRSASVASLLALLVGVGPGAGAQSAGAVPGGTRAAMDAASGRAADASHATRRGVVVHQIGVRWGADGPPPRGRPRSGAAPKGQAIH